jgi:hypothetical protein
MTNRPLRVPRADGAVLAVPAAKATTPSHEWTRMWMGVTALVATITTAIDAALLQRKHDLFTGGFLSVDHLRTPGQVVLFLLGSCLEDAAVAGALAALGLWIARRLALNRAATRVLGTLAALCPLVIADIVSYRILEYLGGAFDFKLMFDLAGGRTSEFVAVASSQLLQLALLLVAVIASVVLVVGVVQRRGRGQASFVDAAGMRRGVGFPASLIATALIVTTIMRVESAPLDNGLRRKPSGTLFGLLIATVTDIDRDGYGLFSRPADTAPFDARIHPYAVDIPGNGIDEDGVGGDLPADYPRYVEPSAAAPSWSLRPDVVLVFLETFRADVVGAVEDGKPVTPRLDALARVGASANYAFSHNGYTVQSRFHLLSGSLANLRGGTTIIDDFNANGYETAYFSGQDDSFGGDGLPIGFERASVFYDARQDRAKRYTTFSTPGSLAVPFTVVEDRVTRFLEHRDAQRPLFLYVNFHDTHFPYTHEFVQPLVSRTVVPRGEIAPGRRDDLWRMYLNTAANVDRAIGDVVDAVKRTTGRTPAVIVTADHGESLFEEGFLGHGYGLNDAQTRIPLVVSGLPMQIEEPWGQAELRDAISGALARLPSGDLRPHVVGGGRPVFQYLGSLDTPAAIALTTAAGRTVYDFRADVFRMPEGTGKRPSELDDGDRRAFLDLIRFWERMVVAGGIRPTSPSAEGHARESAR